MDYYHHARLTVHGREVLCISVVESAAKWVRRYREQGLDGLKDRSSRPRRLSQPTSTEQVLLIETLRRERWTGSRIAQQTGFSRATVSRVLARARLNRMPDLEPPVSVQRCPRSSWRRIEARRNTREDSRPFVSIPETCCRSFFVN